MKKIFIDCGANNGQSTRWFQKSHKDSKTYEIHCFEPNPDLKKKLENNGAIYHPEAVWIENGKTTFYIGHSNLSSTIVKAKYSGRANKKIDVDTIDFSSWIQDNFSETDYIIIKMDIEGAEYEVIDKMLKDKTFDWIDEIYIEFHGNKMNPKPKDNKDLIRQIKNTNTKVNGWGNPPK